MINSPFFDTNNPNKEIKDAHLFGLQDNWYSQYPSVTTNYNYQLNFKGKDGINNAPISIVFSEIRSTIRLLFAQNKDIYAKKLRIAYYRAAVERFFARLAKIQNQKAN